MRGTLKFQNDMKAICTFFGFVFILWCYWVRFIKFSLAMIGRGPMGS